MKKKIVAFFCLISLCVTTKVNSYEIRPISKLPIINLITWYDYFTPSMIRELEKQCKVKVQVNKYYTNATFMRHIQEKSFDIAIYSDNMYPYFIELVETPGTDFGYLNRNLYPDQMKELIEPYNSDTVLFQIGVTGIMYNPDKIAITRDTPVYTLFKKAQGGLVSILDEQFEALHMVQSAGLSSNSDSLAEQLKALPTLLEGTYPLVTTELGRIHEDENFTFAYNWSGDVLKHIDKFGLDYKFTLLDDLSHIAIDVLTLINDKPDTLCVANMMTAPDYLRKVSDYSKYISPFYSIQNPKNTGQSLVTLASQLSEKPIKLQLTSGVDLNIAQGEQLLTSWNQIKIQLSPEVKIELE